ncbi:MAG TPA: DUF2380 domain-containing protein [Candidatus Binataceae bacterium]|nr:DUF2380 domain-containing protein [Candidatus Binataceae bacterium]
MNRSNRTRQRTFCLMPTTAAAACVLALTVPARRALAAPQPGTARSPTVVVADFDLVDLAPEGERYDVEQDKARARLISREVRRLVANSGAFTLLDRGRTDEAPPLDFRSCPACIWDWAKARGAAFVIVGAVEKESRLILWAQMSLLDVARQSVMSESSLSIRDDTDEMWKAAASALTRQILSAIPHRSAVSRHLRDSVDDVAQSSRLKIYL